MPTSYTQAILDGRITTLKQFASQCIRRFGAGFHLRENPDLDNMSLLTVDSYRDTKIAELHEFLKHISATSDDELLKSHKDKLLQDKADNLASIETKNANAKLLNNMLSEVKSWNPPTYDHVQLKQFMLEQLNITIENDCKTEYNWKRISVIEEELLALDVSKIRTDMIDDACASISYHKKMKYEEIERCDKTNQWILDLIKSF